MTSASCPTADPSTSSSATRFSFNRTRAPIPHTSTKSTRSTPRSCSASGTSGKTLSQGRESASWKLSSEVARHSRHTKRLASVSQLRLSSFPDFIGPPLSAFYFFSSFWDHGSGTIIPSVGWVWRLLLDWTLGRLLCTPSYSGATGTNDKVSSGARILTLWSVERPRGGIFGFVYSNLREWESPRLRDTLTAVDEKGARKYRLLFCESLASVLWN